MVREILALLEMSVNEKRGLYAHPGAGLGFKNFLGGKHARRAPL
jgi:hypothetical protein